MINAEFILQQGIDSCRQGQFFEAESEFWRAHQLCIEESDLGGATRVLMIAAISFEEAGLSSKGSVFYEEAEKLLADTSNSQIHAATALSLARLFETKCSFTEWRSTLPLRRPIEWSLLPDVGDQGAGRRWIASEPNLAYAIGAAGRFVEEKVF